MIWSQFSHTRRNTHQLVINQTLPLWLGTRIRGIFGVTVECCCACSFHNWAPIHLHLVDVPYKWNAHCGTAEKPNQKISENRLVNTWYYISSFSINQFSRSHLYEKTVTRDLYDLWRLVREYWNRIMIIEWWNIVRNISNWYLRLRQNFVIFALLWKKMRQIKSKFYDEKH